MRLPINSLEETDEAFTPRSLITPSIHGNNEITATLNNPKW